uniref:Uncharacterized protein n=1 Tax=Romanomermis culicivorax TaxID=13658 RepID=A0A915L9G4_ROMCU
HRRTGISILYPREPGYYQCIVLVQYCAYNPDAQDLGSIRSRAVNITSNMLQPGMILMSNKVQNRITQHMMYMIT